ncbi:acyltransferase family protein [Knoellia subterranea]|uniref:Acyltransferase n=1 Tax=Knoellia subterranea KCTC 19937 TaxID=1385521 RepID=A0A0A0JKY1_9MICO|nr:acyltransferase family protein [Knoellia subterranea]KGN36717.1 acyltransferase [Knoellia subterranea KCTC 19937]
MTHSWLVVTAVARTERAPRRADIEGLRAVAVLAVLAHHAGLPVTGGYVGVDVFFVISGYLITGLLVTELWSTGRIGWGAFVGRRIRRLLPAALLVLVVTAVVSALIVPGLRRREIATDIAGSAGYVVNWVLARRGVDYLASDSQPSPVQHYWSLAVEEQFYVVWPVLLMLLAFVVRRLGRGQHSGGPSRGLVFGVLALPVAASFGWSVHLARTSPAEGYFVTTTRAWELGVGALLAVALAGRERPALAPRCSAAWGWAALGVLLVVVLSLPEGLAWPGAWALLVTLPTAALLWIGWLGPTRGPVAVLGTAPMLWVGALSYSLYLWHWPFVVLGDAVAVRFDLDFPVVAPLLLTLASVVPAWLSWRFVETPIHHGSWLRSRPRAVLAAGLAASAVTALAALPLLHVSTPFRDRPAMGDRPPLAQLGAAAVHPGDDAAPVDSVEWVVPDPLRSGEDRPAADVDHCQVDDKSTTAVACVFGEAGSGTTIALVGDSKAMQWLPALEEAAAARGWRIVTFGKSLCTFAEGATEVGGTAYPACDRWNAEVTRALEAERPDLVVTSGSARVAWAEGDRVAGRERLVEGYAARWRQLVSAGTPVVVVGDSPRSPDDLDVCAALHPDRLSRCAFDRDAAIGGSGLPVQREAAQQVERGVTFVDLTPWLCPGRQCPVVVGHVTVHRPGDHVTATYARTLGPVLGEAVAAAFGEAAPPPVPLTFGLRQP